MSGINHLQLTRTHGRRLREIYERENGMIVRTTSGGRSIRWEFSQFSDTVMNVGNGAVTRNGCESLVHTTSGAGDVAGFSSDGVCYIVLTLSADSGKDPRVRPNAISLGMSASWPTNDEGNYQIVLGEVTVASNIISGYKQYLFSDIDDSVAWPDSQSGVSGVGESLDFIASGNGEGLLEIAGWDAPTDISSLDATDRVLIRTIIDDDPIARYITWVDFLTQILTDLHPVENWVELGDTAGSLGYEGDLVHVEGGILDFIHLSDLANSISHYDLEDIIPGTYVLHDHGNYWQNVESDSGRYGAPSWDYLVNNGSSIGDSYKNEVIDLDAQQLITALGNPAMDWANRTLLDTDGITITADWDDQQLFDAAGDISADWNLRTLYGDEWHVAMNTLFLVDDGTDITPGSSDTGAAQIVGGLSVAQGLQADVIRLLSNPNDNVWSATQLRTYVAGSSYLYSADGDFAIRASGDVSLIPGANLTIDGTAGITRSGNTNVVADDGTLIPIAIKKGIVVAA